MTTIAPTPLAARRSKSAGKLPVITLPTGRQVSIRAYVQAWKKLLKELGSLIDVFCFPSQ